MSFPRVLEEAAEEIDAAAAFLEETRPGSGRRFVSDYERCLRQALEFPESGHLIADPPPPPRLRAFNVQQFGYTLVVSPDIDGHPTVIALAHQSREPGYWKKRLGGEP